MDCALRNPAPFARRPESDLVQLEATLQAQLRAGKAANGGYPELSQEYIVTAKPQLIFLADNQPNDGGQTPVIVAKRPGWAAIPAVENHEVVALNDDIASRWGPRLPQLVAQIAQAVERAPSA